MIDQKITCLFLNQSVVKPKSWLAYTHFPAFVNQLHQYLLWALVVITLVLILEQFSVECSRLANHNSCRQSNEPIRTHSKCMQMALSTSKTHASNSHFFCWYQVMWYLWSLNSKLADFHSTSSDRFFPATEGNQCEHCKYITLFLHKGSKVQCKDSWKHKEPSHKILVQTSWNKLHLPLKTSLSKINQVSFNC